MKTFWSFSAVIVSLGLAVQLPFFTYLLLADAEPMVRNGLGLLSILGAIIVFVGCLRWMVTGSPFKTIAPPHQDEK